MEYKLIYLALISYFIGSIPFAYILTRIFGYGDIRKIGSGNVGATNVLRTGKKGLALTVLFLDIIKGFLPITLLYFCYKDQLYTNLIIFLGGFAIMGHIFPIWLKFKGGKGVATYIGYILGINYSLGILFILCWLIIAIVKKYSSLASILSIIAVPLFSIFLLHNLSLFFILTFLSILIIIKHNTNIKRLLRGSETKIKL